MSRKTTSKKKKAKGRSVTNASPQPQVPVDLGNVDVVYDESSDVLAIEFGSRAKRSWSYAYEDFLVMHGGTLDGRAVLQGFTFINAKELRRRALERQGIVISDAELAQDFGHIPAELADFYKNTEITVVGADVWIANRARAHEPGPKIYEAVTPTIGFVHDIAGRLVSVVIRNSAFAIDRATLVEIFDMFFDALLGPPDAEKVDPKRLAFGAAVAEVLAPLLAA
jgi:hypothetical protein